MLLSYFIVVFLATIRIIQDIKDNVGPHKTVCGLLQVDDSHLFQVCLSVKAICNDLCESASCDSH